MRDLLFRNLTSDDKKRRVIASSEVAEREGIRSTIHRHFVCIVKEVKDASTVEKPAPYLYVLKESNSKLRLQRFFCRVKSSVFTISKGKIYLILYMHSLKISLQESAKVAA